MKSENIISRISSHPRLVLCSLFIILCALGTLRHVLKNNGKVGFKVFKIPESGLVFHLDEADGEYRTLSIHRARQKDAPGENRIRMSKNVPWRSMITISTYSPDTVFVSSSIDIVSAVNVRIEHDSQSVDIRAEDDGRYIRCWFAPMANKMFMATGGEKYCEITPVVGTSPAGLAYLLLNVICVLLLFVMMIMATVLKAEGTADGPIQSWELEELTNTGERLIRIDDIRRDFLEKVLGDFMADYQLEDITESILGSESRYMLRVRSTVDFYHFALLINYLTYSDRSRRYAVTGWYEMGTCKNAPDNDILSGKTLMFYIPDSDEEYDNAYLVTPDGIHLKLPFGDSAGLHPAESETREYEALPKNPQSPALYDKGKFFSCRINESR